MSKDIITRVCKVKIGGEMFKVKVQFDKEIVDSEYITRNVEITFDPKDADRLSKIMGDVKPGEFSVGFNPDYVDFKKEFLGWEL